MDMCDSLTIGKIIRLMVIVSEIGRYLLISADLKT